MPRYRAHIALTVWPITALLVLELARLWPALKGASSFAAASPVTWTALITSTVVVVVSLAAYARGWSLLGLRWPEGAGPYRTEGCLRLQKLAGGLAWALVLAHLALQWFMSVRVGLVALSQYELMRGFFSRPVVLGYYVFGLAALGLFLSQGIAATVRSWGGTRTPETSRWIEVGCTFASAMVMLMAINVLSHFVTGRAYWMGP